MENEVKQLTGEDIKQQLMNDPAFIKSIIMGHTPRKRLHKVGRNEICPFCDSGKKFKNCECYATHNHEYENPIKYADE